MYDLERVGMIVAERRRIFSIKAAFFAVLMLAALILAIYFAGSEIGFVSALIEFPLVLLAFHLYRKSGARVLLSKEVRGVNIKEHEYGIQHEPGVRLHRRVSAPSTGANRKPSPLRINGNVYLKLESGDIKELSGLYKSHIDIYEEGDTLLKLAGTRFPIVVSRDAKEQPCPLCGEVNKMTECECKRCKLRIFPKS